MDKQKKIIEDAWENRASLKPSKPVKDAVKAAIAGLDAGKLRVAKGVRMQVLKGGANSLYGMNWLVKGVIGSPKG